MEDDTDTKGYKNLMLQIFNVRNFAAAVGGGIFIFSTAYLNNQWGKAQVLFWSWIFVMGIWLLFLIITYRIELWVRLTLLVFSIFKKIIPILILLTSLYFILFPFDLIRTISLFVLVFIIALLVMRNKKLLKETGSRAHPIEKIPGRKRISLIKVLEGWTATETANEQGTDYREINLEGKPLKILEFRVKPSTVFWRAGFKITDPNGSILPLRTRSSLLFHVGSSDSHSRFGITAYIDGGWDSTLNKTIDYNNSFISIRFEVNEKNFVKCFINDKLEYKPKRRVDPRILEKVFLAVWGDGNPFRVEFDNIQFATIEYD